MNGWEAKEIESDFMIVPSSYKAMAREVSEERRKLELIWMRSEVE